MRNFISKAAAIGLFLYSSDLSHNQIANASEVSDVDQIKTLAHINRLAQQSSDNGSQSKKNELEHLMSTKFKELEDKINMEANKVDKLE